MSALTVESWDHSLFDNLQRLLTRVSSRAKASEVRGFEKLLNESRPWLLHLTNLPGPSDEAKRHVEQNPEVSLPRDARLTITGDLVQIVQNVSAVLSISQRLAAVVVAEARRQQARYPACPLFDVAIFTYHEWASSMLDFFAEVLRTTLTPTEGYEPSPEMKDWIIDLFTADVNVDAGASGTKGRLVDQILGLLDRTHGEINKLLTGGISLSNDTLSYRVTALRAEQCKLAGMLVVICKGGCISRGQAIKLIKWLKRQERTDGIVYVVFAAVASVFRPLDAMEEEDKREERPDAWLGDVKFMRLAAVLSVQEEWKHAGLGECIRLVWCMFYLSALRIDKDIDKIGLDVQLTEQYITDSLGGQAFTFMREIMFNTRRQRGLEYDDRNLHPIIQSAQDLEPELDNVIYQSVQDLIEDLATKRNLVKALRNREEDIAVRRSASPPTQYQAFLSLIATVYSTLPADSAMELWESVHFTSIFFELRNAGFQTPAFWAALAAISRGEKCAGKCYEMMKSTRLNWGGLLKFFAHYQQKFQPLYDPSQSSKQYESDPMSIEDRDVLIGWTRVLATVVQYSQLARTALLQSNPNPIGLLFDIINRDTGFELKAVIFEAITAFCTDADGRNKATEHHDRVTFRDQTIEASYVESSRISPHIGWVLRAESNEMEARQYPLTRAYVKFLIALLPAETQRASRILRRGIQYAVDRILLVKGRIYLRHTDEVELLEPVLELLDKALQHFDIGTLEGVVSLTAPADALHDNPGFSVILRTLGEKEIFGTFADVVDRATSVRSSLYTLTLLSVLRIYYRILDIQLVFSDVLLLALADSRSARPFRRPMGLQSLDQHLLSRLDNITSIALLVGDSDAAVSFVSVKIIQALAQSPVFSRSDMFHGEYTMSVNRLAGIIDASDNSIRIAQGFCNKLSAAGEPLSEKESREIGARALKGEEVDSALVSVTRSTILDILLEGTLLATSPNFAHFLLGFDFRAPDFGLQDYNSPESRLSCLQVILTQLREPLVDTDPVMAAKGAHLVHQLFAHPTTGRTTMSYATSVSNFAAEQLDSLPIGLVEQEDGEGVADFGVDKYTTTAELLVAFIDYNKWIVSSVALDMYAYSGNGSLASVVATLLFDGIDGTRPPLLLDVLGLIDVRWEEEPIEDIEMKSLAEFDFDQFKSEVDWWDLEGLERALKMHAPSAVEEIAFIIKRLGQRNRETDVSLAKGSFLTAWNALLKVALAMLFKHASEDRQEALMLDVLDAMLIRLGGELATGVLEILCESVLVTVTSLVSLLLSFDGTNLPVDRLTSVLQRIVETVSRPGTTESARGNLYAAISQYLQLLAIAPPIDDNVSVLSAVTSVPTSSIQKATLSVIGSRRERFLGTLCRDALDVRDVWKTECFSLLCGLVAACQSERDRAVLAPAIQAGFLPLFVRTIKDQEMALQECLSPDHENLHAFWVYEAKVAFLLAVASSRKGAEQLLDAGVFEMFATCGFVNVQPLNEEVLADPTAAEVVLRQHRVLIYALQLLSRVLSSLQQSARSGAGHAISFLNAHRDAILLLLRESQMAVTITGIEGLRLIVSIMGMVAHKVPSDDLRSPSGFGGFHLAVLSAAARFFERSSWVDMLVNKAEEDEAGADVMNLNHTILIYLCISTTGLKAREGIPVLVTGIQRSTAGSTKYISSAPTLQTAVDLAANLAEESAEVGRDYAVLEERVEGGLEVMTENDVAALESGVLPREEITAEEAGMRLIARGKLLHNMVESVLLLLWRHLLFYANEARGTDPVRPGDLSASLAFSSQIEGSRSVVSRMRTLERVTGALRGTLDLIEESEAKQHPALRASGDQGGVYSRMLTRRLRELVSGVLGDAQE